MNKEGTFDKCTNCKNCINCCMKFDKINSPTLNKEEIELISKDYNDFYVKISDNLYRLKTIDNKCIFYNDNKCNIYKDWPLDCKLYPFDIIKKDNDYLLILYKLECINVDFFINNSYLIDSIIEKIKPWIDEFTDESNYTLMKDYEYIVIKRLDIVDKIVEIWYNMPH